MDTIYEVSLREGAMCKNAGLRVEFCGHVARVFCAKTDANTFWAQRLRFLRENPNA